MSFIKRKELNMSAEYFIPGLQPLPPKNKNLPKLFHTVKLDQSAASQFFNCHSREKVSLLTLTSSCHFVLLTAP